MRASMCCVAMLMSTMGMAAGEVAAVENNSSLAPLTPLTIPAQQTPIVLVQAAAPAAGTTPQPDYLLTGCQETESSGPTGDPRSVFRAVSPAGMLAAYIENHSQRSIDTATEATIKTILLQGTKHGNLVAGISTSGRTTYRYDAEPNYVGNDRAVFLAQFEGKVYKIVLNLVVSLQVNENPLTDEQTPVCPEPTLIKVTKPSSGASGYSSGYDLSSVSVTFADLAGAAIGQTNTDGIILDSNAAGYNWFIDTLTANNSEFL